MSKLEKLLTDTLTKGLQDILEEKDFEDGKIVLTLCVVHKLASRRQHSYTRTRFTWQPEILAYGDTTLGHCLENKSQGVMSSNPTPRVSTLHSTLHLLLEVRCLQSAYTVLVVMTT